MYELMRRRVQEKENYEFEDVISQIVMDNSINLRLPSFTKLKREFLEKFIYSLLNPSKQDLEEESIETMEEEKQEEPIKTDSKTEKDLIEVLSTLEHILEAS